MSILCKLLGHKSVEESYYDLKNVKLKITSIRGKIRFYEIKDITSKNINKVEFKFYCERCGDWL
jgi:ribosomal protein L33